MADVRRNLDSCIHALIRMDASRTPVQQPCKGHFEVLERDPHHFNLDVRSTLKRITLTCLKPFFLEEGAVRDRGGDATDLR